MTGANAETVVLVETTILETTITRMVGGKKNFMFGDLTEKKI